MNCHSLGISGFLCATYLALKYCHRSPRETGSLRRYRALLQHEILTLNSVLQLNGWACIVIGSALFAPYIPFVSLVKPLQRLSSCRSWRTGCTMAGYGSQIECRLKLSRFLMRYIQGVSPVEVQKKHHLPLSRSLSDIPSSKPISCITMSTFLSPGHA